MHKRWRAGFLGLALLLAGWSAKAHAQDPNTDFGAYRALFSVAALGPARGPAAVTGYTLHYRGATSHAAFGLAALPDGRSVWRFVTGQPDVAAAREAVQLACNRDAARLLGAGHGCRVIAADGTVETLGRPAFRTIEAAIGPFRAAPLMFRHGPQSAEGVVVWSHGYGGRASDHRQRSAPGVLALLNDAGWDVMRFDRDPAEDDLPVALAGLRRGLPLLREAGYRRIVLAGQSRGGWQSVMLAAEQPEAVHAVLAFAPAAHGEAARPNNLAAASEDFRRLLAGLPPAGPRLAVAVFADDPFDPDPAARAALVAEAATRRSAPTLALFPEPPIRGHSGVNDWRFTRALGPCVLTLVQAPAGAAPRGVRRRPCGGG
ncbi:hypothetical protein GXW78_05260 [Roseomonas terrae]|jgi:pimeloyl-ACP methyl ester carboxylesterase|uniref:Alpha/beta hydrolase n=1 Tax=Neoroseomonas terrae TaxID=424799 RepID=A0ABS5EDH4_9PROT|nr:hypothetical protein [Neoroseomonas terrae]MBR0649061.1 hypothetical protein [Neoroseomonas terrae]